MDKEMEMELAPAFIYDPSLVLYLPLWKKDGATIASDDAYGHLCTVTGALWTPQGRSFDGIDDHIDCGNNPAILNFTAMTILFWMKTSISANVRDAMDSGYGAVNGYRFYFEENARNAYAMLRNGGEASSAVITYSDNVWTQVGLIWDGTTLWPIKNGVLGTSTPHAGATASASNLWLGREADVDAHHWNGTLGELVIYSRASTPQEIQQIYLTTKWRYT